MIKCIREIFSSIQGEGIYVGKRQIFIRFTKCNLDCYYCDTPHKRDVKFTVVQGKKKILNDINDVIREIENLKTRDVFSISLTGGEPLLYTEIIEELAEKIDIPLYLETNSTLPDRARKIEKFITYAALDIKTNYPNFYEKTLETIKIFKNKKSIIKVVVADDLNEEKIEKISLDIRKINDIPLILQPITEKITGKFSKIEREKYLKKILKFSEIASNYLSDVRIIPQVHKFLKIK
ncbi:MAG: 7-carboxy-7-deazaguanine synthase QueE [Candidatus Altarchaeaceae archaeon]